MSVDRMRIGELAARSGVPAETLRAWERRHGLFSPLRSEGGFRLYSEADAALAARMRASIRAGIPASEAARRLTRPGEAPGLEMSPGILRVAFAAALREMDDGRIQQSFDRLLAAHDLETVVVDVILPELRRLGEEWAGGQLAIAQEHFAVSILRGRLLGLARGWDAGLGPRALLACPPEETHDISLIAFGLLLRRRGWRLTFLGADTPFGQIGETAAALKPELVLVYSPFPERIDAARAALAELAGTRRVVLAGAGSVEDAGSGARIAGQSVSQVADALTARLAP
ncbi:MAG: MerR family DNA-binding transcriptional regulator [Dehalococcoidia bacterium]